MCSRDADEFGRFWLVAYHARSWKVTERNQMVGPGCQASSRTSWSDALKGLLLEAVRDSIPGFHLPMLEVPSRPRAGLD